MTPDVIVGFCDFPGERRKFHRGMSQSIASRKSTLLEMKVYGFELGFRGLAWQVMSKRKVIFIL